MQRPEIESGVPLPEITLEWSALARELKVGQSVCLEEEIHVRTLSQAMRRIGKSFLSRKIPGEKRYRLWCTGEQDDKR